MIDARDINPEVLAKPCPRCGEAVGADGVLVFLRGDFVMLHDECAALFIESGKPGMRPKLNSSGVIDWVAVHADDRRRREDEIALQCRANPLYKAWYQGATMMRAQAVLRLRELAMNFANDGGPQDTAWVSSAAVLSGAARIIELLLPMSPPPDDADSNFPRRWEVP